MKALNNPAGKTVSLTAVFILVSLMFDPVAVRYALDTICSDAVVSQAVVYAADEEKPDAEPGDKAGDGAVQEPPPCPECPDPAKVVLNGLEDKRKAVAKAEEQLKQERKQLEKFKEEIDEQLEKLSGLKQQIASDLALFDQKKTARELEKEAAFEANVNKLVKVYAGMKPKEAGAIIDKMDIVVARQILSRMRETSAAQILSFVNTERAAKISEGIVYPK